MNVLKKLIQSILAAPLLLSIYACSTFQLSPNSSAMSEADYQTAIIVYQRLQNDTITSTHHVQVVAENGVITLSGRIEDPQVRRRIISIAEGTQSVQAVVDRLTR